MVGKVGSGWADRQEDQWMNSQMDDWTDGRINRLMIRQTDGWKELIDKWVIDSEGGWPDS